jgi:hypothetical protein
MLVYYIICTYISPQTDSLVDEAVLPAKRRDMLPTHEIVEGTHVEDLKEPYVGEKRSPSPPSPV